MSGEKVKIEISREAYEQAKRFIEEQGGFKSVEELVEFLITEAVGAEGGEEISPEEEEKIKERLRRLGYM
ncbi:MAG: CopG family transcriptional regulator [Desulfurococcales archaeon]|nr:CopG family transcriptional regulator [Desulfurococcales archaeon]